MSNVVALDQTRDFEFRDNRLPYVPDLADAYGIDNVRWRVLINTIFPSAKTVESIIMALTYCKARNLDIFKRPVHIVPMWSTATNGMIDTIWPGISEIRTTAFRTGQFAGMGAAEFGPTIEQKLGDKSVKFPEWCQITATRMLNGAACTFVSPKVHWLESYAVAKRGELAPNEMWARRPFGQIEKCAEAAALRRAFPEEIGNDYAAEEMEGQVLSLDAHREARRAPAPPPPVKPAAAIEHKPAVEVAKVETQKPEPAATATRRAPPPPSAKPAPVAAPLDFAAAFRVSLSVVKSIDEANAVYEEMVSKQADTLSPVDIDECDAILREECARFWPEGE